MVEALKAALEKRLEGSGVSINAIAPHAAGLSILFATKNGKIGHALVGQPIRGNTDEASLDRWWTSVQPVLAAEVKKLDPKAKLPA